MSSSTLNRFLQKETGKTLVDLRQSIRIRYATNLLCTSSDSITGIGYSVGFETKKSFFATFKKVMGMTPSEFKRMSKRISIE